MDIATLIKTQFQKSFDWKGRASRTTFWYFFLFWVVVYFVILVLAFILTAIHLWFIAWLLWVIAFFAWIFPTLSVGARRLQDQDKNPLWLLIWLVPFGIIVLIVFWAMEGTSGPNQYGAATDPY